MKRFRNVLRVELHVDRFEDEGRIRWDDLHNAVALALEKAAGRYDYDRVFVLNDPLTNAKVGKLTIETERVE